MTILRKISIYISFVALFFMHSTKAFAGTAEATSYINTVYSLHLCETGSTDTTCKNPLVIRMTPTGTDMDIGSASGIGLYARYLKRISAQSRNLISSIVNPFERIGYPE